MSTTTSAGTCPSVSDMRRVGIAMMKEHPSEYLRAVEAGREVVVTDRDRPITRISPMPSAGTTVQLVAPRAAFDEVRDRERVPSLRPPPRPGPAEAEGTMMAARGCPGPRGTSVRTSG